MQYDAAAPFSFIRSFASSVGLLVWIPGVALRHWERNCSRSKAIIRTRHRQEIAVVVGSDYMGLVRVSITTNSEARMNKGFLASGKRILHLIMLSLALNAAHLGQKGRCLCVNIDN